MMKLRKNILVLDNHSELENMIREPLLEQMKSLDVAPVFVRAKDGPDAAVKSENQKFDMVLIDTEVPRLMDGGFIYGLHSYKNTQDADLMVVSPKELKDLPESLRQSTYFKKPVDPKDLIHSILQNLKQQSSSDSMTSATKSSPSGTGASANAATGSSTKYAVDVRVINAVITATTKVLKQFGVSQITMGKPTIRSPQEPLMGEVSSVIDIQSQSFRGHLSISFEKTSFLEVASAMLMEEQSELNKDNQDAVGEINNIIFGNAKAEIENYGVQMTVPKVLIGAGQHVPSAQGSAGMMIPFTSQKGSFYLVVVAVPLAHQ